MDIEKDWYSNPVELWFIWWERSTHEGMESRDQELYVPD